MTPNEPSNPKPSKPMRIACVIHDCNREGGQERCAAELVDRLSLAHEVHLYAATARGLSADRVVFHSIRVPRRPILVKNILFFAQASMAIRRQGFQVVHAQGASMWGQHVTTAHFCEAAWLARHRDLAEASEGPGRAVYHAINSRVSILLENLIYRRRGTQVVIAVSKATREDLAEHYGLDPARIPVIYDGVDLETFHPNQRPRWRGAIRKQLRIADDACVVLFVGAFERKGLGYVLKALRILQDTPVHLLVLGSGQGSALRQLAQRLGLGDRTTFLGRQADVHRYFAAADLFVLPALYEPFGMAVLEAMASGLPVVTSRTAGVAELITDREDGLLLDDPTDATAIATAVHLLVDSPELREHLGRTAREKVSGYSWDYVVRETLNVYRTVMDGRA